MDHKAVTYSTENKLGTGVNYLVGGLCIADPINRIMRRRRSQLTGYVYV